MRVRCALMALAITMIGVVNAHAVLVAHYKMDAPTQTTNEAGNFLYEPNLVIPSAPNAPAHLTNGGYLLSGAYQFDGTNDYIDFGNSSYLYAGITLPAGAAVTNQWTINFWVKTTDAGTFTGYSGTTQVPVWGNTDGNYGIGIDGGLATFKNAFNGRKLQGATNVADGLPHYLGFVARPDGYLDIYVDGVLDGSMLDPSVVDATPPPAWPQIAASEFGRGYWNGVQFHYGSGIGFTLDDVRVYNNALSAYQMFQITPEPGAASAFVALAIGVFGYRRRRNA